MFFKPPAIVQVNDALRAPAVSAMEADNRIPFRLQVGCGLTHTLVCVDDGQVLAFGGGKCVAARAQRSAVVHVPHCAVAGMGSWGQSAL